MRLKAHISAFRESDDGEETRIGRRIPAITTQFRADFSLDIEATRKVAAALVADGVSGLIACGTVGENNALSRDEKLAVMEALKDAAGGRSSPASPNTQPRKRASSRSRRSACASTGSWCCPP